MWRKLFFKDNICGDGAADIQLIGKYKKEFRFSLYIIDAFSKYAWLNLLKDKKFITVTNAFQNIYMNLLTKQNVSRLK